MKSRTLIIGSVICLAFAAPVSAGPRDDVLAAMSKCTSITDNTERLACFDALKPQLQAALAAPAAPPEQVAQQEDSSSWFGLDHVFGGRKMPQTEPKQFGSDNLPKPEQAKIYPPAPGRPPVEDLDSITATATDYANTYTGRFIVFLDNGQVWQQIEGDTDTAHFRRNPADNMITISRALMGSYTLKINGSNRGFKVKRVK